MFPLIPIEQRVRMLAKPSGPIDVVLDTDTYNEVDDQYALAYLIRSTDRLNLLAIHAAPFLNQRSSSPGEGMHRSYGEIRKVLTLMGREDLLPLARRGSEQFLADEETPVSSDAVENLVRLARGHTAERPLYVVAIGAITNVASALLTAPDIADRLVLVWLGGHGLHWPDTKEFNLFQDVAAARVVLGCGVPVVMLPCAGVVSEFRTTGPELEHHLRGRNPLCDYLVEVTMTQGSEEGHPLTWSRVLWDVTAVAWLLPGDFMDDYLVPTPIPEYDGHYGSDPTRHLMRYVYRIKRDNLYADLFTRLAALE
ncbi:MAG: nucleoside hydrolase [Promicromonosporaceae bacterium]|nr:nucleoside hydrolase [Promicromonosporaceae bacterium]